MEKTIDPNVFSYLTNDEDDTVSKSNNNENNEHNGIFYLWVEIFKEIFKEQQRVFLINL